MSSSLRCQSRTRSVNSYFLASMERKQWALCPRFATVALDYANASSALSGTRSRMIDLCNDSFSAVLAGRHSTVTALERQYNSQVSIHNRQVSTSNAALAKLREVLRV